jgi:hypothetical protein
MSLFAVVPHTKEHIQYNNNYQQVIAQFPLHSAKYEDARLPNRSHLQPPVDNTGP